MGYNVRRFEPGVRSRGVGGPMVYRLNQIRRVFHEATDGAPAIRAYRMHELWRVAEQATVDVIIVCHDFLSPAELAELKRRTGAETVLWFPDHLANFGRAFFMNGSYDGLFFKDPYIVRILRNVVKAPVYYLPECFNPKRHTLPEAEIGNDPVYRCDITTAGSQHSWRVAFFGHLTSYDVKLWGSPPPLWMNTVSIGKMYQGVSVYNDEKVRAFRGARIVINDLHYGEVWGVNVRTFEVAGAGAFQMVDWRPGLGQLFQDGRELISFNGITDLKQKIEFWLPRDSERREVSQAGMRRAHAEHTYRQRLELLLNTLAGREKGFPMPDLRY